MDPLDVVRLPQLMRRGNGRPDVTIALIDGPVARDLPDFSAANIREVPGRLNGICSQADTVACAHGTFVAGVLVAQRRSAAPAICPGCTLLVRSIFAEVLNGNRDMPRATPEELAEAILDAVRAGARIINLSAALVQSPRKGEKELEEALSFAAHRDVLVVAAAGNQGTVGSSAITRHAGVIPVAACDFRGCPLGDSNLGSSIGRRGLSAPGEGVTSLGSDGMPLTLGGTSAAAPFVSGAIALLWSEFPAASGADIKLALMQNGRLTRKTVVPPVLDAWAAFEAMTVVQSLRRAS
jgi:subtilisin family serine protease